MKQKKGNKLCILDFDGTLVDIDTIRHMMINELWFLIPNVVFCVFAICIGKLLCNRLEYKFRSLLKLILLKKILRLDPCKYQRYIEYFREKLNHEVLHTIIKNRYDYIVIISASETDIIKKTLNGFLTFDLIIANDMREISNKYRTCWKNEKVERLRRAIPDFMSYNIDLFTDSNDDKPLMAISGKIYIINKGKIIHD